jgi:DNA-binding NarL/FixJ family response regulator
MPLPKHDPIEHKLDLILRLLALLVASESSVTEGARALKLAGLDNKTIAEVLNTTDATVRTLTSNIRRAPARPKRKKG